MRNTNYYLNIYREKSSGTLKSIINDSTATSESKILAINILIERDEADDNLIAFKQNLIEKENELTSSKSSNSTSEPKEKKMVVGFWLRLLSDIIDTTILGIFGMLLILPFKTILYRIGENGLWIGLIITFLYTGILQSYIGKGQSLAKKMIGIQVLTLDGNFLSLQRSFSRYIVIALIFYNSWIWLAITSMFPFLNNNITAAIYSYAIITILLGVIFLIALHPQKRGLHDLIAGSIVTRKGIFNKSKLDELYSALKIKRAYIIVGVVSTTLMIGLILMTTLKINSFDHIRELTKLQNEIQHSTDFTNVRVAYNTFTSKTKKMASINVSAFIKKSLFDDKQLRKDESQKIINILKNDYSKLHECNNINIQIRTGFNIGITSSYIRTNTPYNIHGEPLT